MQVKDLTLEQLKTLIRETVLETLEDYLIDPDLELNLKEEVRQQLINSQQRTEAGERGISLEEVRQKYTVL